MQSKCLVCGIKTSRFVKEQQPKGLLSSLGIKTLLSKIAFSGNILFKCTKMNEILNKFLLAGDKFMPEMHLKQPGFTCSVCGPFTETKKLLKNLCKLEIQILFTKMNLVKLVFDMIWLMVNQTIYKNNSIRESFKR